ncbi:MAG: EamA family transporter [Pseudomonadota bacterium]
MTNLGESWQLWAFLAAIFAALTAIFAKLGVNSLNADFATFLRTIVVVVVLGAILALTKQFQSLDGLTFKSAGFLIASGLATGASWVCYFRALKLGNASQVAPVDKLSVVMVAIFGVMFLGESLSLGGWIGVAMIAAGAIIISVT